jgi:hypothetical protein
MLISLSAAAAPADNRDAVYEYNDLVVKMVISPRAGDAFFTSFSQRVSRADLLARGGNRKLISEGTVVQAFNDLMIKVTDPEIKGPPLKTNAAIVHQMRLNLQGISPDLSSVGAHPSECTPSEAFLLMYWLLHIDPAKAAAELTTKAQPGLSVHFNGPNYPDVLYSHYTESHSHSDTLKLYDQMAKTFGI